MASVTSTRPTMNMSSSARSSRFGEFPPLFPATTAQAGLPTFGQTGSWQASSGIWGTNTIGSGLPSTRRDVSRSRDGVEDKPSGSSALAASSEADVSWNVRTSGPWNPTPPASSSPPRPPSNESASPTFPRAVSASQVPTALHGPSARPPVGHPSSFSGRARMSGSFEPSSQSFKYARKPSFALGDDKENSLHLGGDAAARFKIDPLGPDGPFLTYGTNTSRESSVPPSRASNSEANSLGNGMSYASFGHTPTSSVSSQRPSFSGMSSSYNPKTTYRLYDLTSQSTEEISARFSGMGLGDAEQFVPSQVGTGSLNHSPNSTVFPQSYFNATAPAWTDASDITQSFPYLGQHDNGDAMYASSRRFPDRSASQSHPTGMDPGTSFNTPTNLNPPSDHGYRGRDPRFSTMRQPEVDRRYQNHAQFAPQAYAYPSQFAPNNPYVHPAAYFPSPQGSQHSVPYGYPNMPVQGPYSPMPVPPPAPREHDSGAGVRSSLLDEFRADPKAARRYDLKHIYGHVVEFSGDQHGSRFIQSKLETANSDEKEQIFREILPNALQLMTDVFGNYVIQKLFEHGNQVQKKLLGDAMRNHVMELTMGVYGCRVVQKALEYVLADQQAELISELSHDPMRCVKDQNGNHVIQKAIERLPVENIRFILDAFRGQVHNLATHAFGCRVIQRILDYCAPRDQASILEELHQCAAMIVTDQFGNYVTQHVLENGRPEDRAWVIAMVTTQLLPLSKHKFASNVVEKSIQYGTEEQRRAIVMQVTTPRSDGTSLLQLMMKDQYGNYVIQKLLTTVKGPDLTLLVEAIKPQLAVVKRSNNGKQIVAIEKIIFSMPASSYLPSSSSAAAAAAIPSTSTSSQATSSAPAHACTAVENNTDDAPLPMLTQCQNSPQSSSLPSTRGSTADEAQAAPLPPPSSLSSAAANKQLPFAAANAAATASAPSVDDKKFAKVGSRAFAEVLVHGS